MAKANKAKYPSSSETLTPDCPKCHNGKIMYLDSGKVCVDLERKGRGCGYVEEMPPVVPDRSPAQAE